MFALSSYGLSALKKILTALGIAQLVFNEQAAPAAPGSGGIFYIDSTTKLPMMQLAFGVPMQVLPAMITRRPNFQQVSDSAALTNDNTLTATIANGKKYRFKLVYYFTTVNTSGFKIDLAGGSGTVSSLQGLATAWNIAAPAFLSLGEFTGLGTGFGVTASGTNVMVELEGTLVASNNGTIIPRFCQNVETGAAENCTARAASYMEVVELP